VAGTPWLTVVGDNDRMYLGKERRDRTVALVLAAALVGVAVLGLVVTISSNGSATAGTEGSPYGAAPSQAPIASRATQAPAPPLGQVVHQHGDQPPIDPAGVVIGHPWRLVGTLIGVLLLFGCGILIAHEQRRRAEGGGPSDGPGEWIS